MGSNTIMKLAHILGYFLIYSLLGAVLVMSFELFLVTESIIENRSKENELNASRTLAFDGKYTAAELSEMYPLVGDHLKYRPWVQFGNYDHTNKYSVVQNGIRKTTPDQGCSGSSFSAWFFGGSTMYGVGVPWWDSIPSQFVQHAKKRGFCVTATNYGVPYFYSAQEAVYLCTELIRTRGRPHFVLFLDGLNEFAEPGSSIKVEPFFTPVLDEAIPYGPTIQMRSVGPALLEQLATYHFIREKLFAPAKVESASRRNYLIPNLASVSQDDLVETAAREIVKNYLSTRTLLRSICTEHKIKCVQFLQPLAIKDYHPPDSDLLTESFRKSDGRLYLAGYKYLVEQSLADDHVTPRVGYGIAFFDISDTLGTYRGIPYVDSIHYSPRAIDVISEKMVDIIFR
jgi:hypothetical protein